MYPFSYCQQQCQRGYEQDSEVECANLNFKFSVLDVIA